MKIVVGMSGGVDSSVAAYLLKEQGHDVIGLFMHNWEEQGADGVCVSEHDFEDVRTVCARLEIPHYSVNFAKEYRERVFSTFLEEYANGRTPNPDVLCNREIKFGPFLEFALSLGAEKIATGHYCGLNEVGGQFFLKKARDQNKDQTYFLNQLNQNQLSKTLFPLAELEKSDIRKIAQKCGFSTAEKKDSTGICFIGERNFKQFLQGYLPAQPGEIVDMTGQVVGKHDGLMFYTLGQRRGLGIGGVSGAMGGRWFVAAKQLEQNRLIVSHGDESVLLSNGLVASNLNWIPSMPTKNEFDCFAKFRYRQSEQAVHVSISACDVRVDFANAQRAITPGQYVVFYDKENCIGGGVIDSSF